MEEEKWLAIPGYEGLYEVSNLGRIRSLDRMVRDSRNRVRKVSGQMRKASVNSTGRLQVGLWREDGMKNMKVHRAVALAFLGPAPEWFEVCHNDGDPLNNRLENLRWGTKKENSADAVRMKRLSAQNRTHCPRGHLLEAPNLTASGLRNGWRVCLACARASACARARGDSLSQELADTYYAKIKVD